MSSVFEQVFILFVFAFTGFLLSKLKRIEADKVSLLSTLEFYVFLPCMSFETFAQQCSLTYLKTKYPLILISVGILLLLELLARCIAPHLSKKHYQQLVYRYSLIAPNFGFFGYSLMRGLFGAEGLMDMMMFCLPLSIYTTTIGYAVLTNQPGKLSVKKMLTPSIYGMFLGAIIGVTGICLPNAIMQIVEKSSVCVAPISMLLAGAVIAQYNFKELLTNKQAYFISFMRLIAIPAMIFFLLKTIGLEIAILSAVITYCCPCGLNPIVYGKLANQDCRDGASLTLLSTVFSMLTIPLCVYLFLG